MVGKDKGHEALDFTSGYFAGFDLSGGNWKRCDFSHSDLRDARLEKGHFDYARFDHAEMNNAHAAAGHFNNADFRTGAILDGIDATSAHFRECTGSQVRFTGGTLSGADFSGAILPNSGLEGAVLKNTIFRRAQLKGSTFGFIEDTDFNLEGAAIDGSSVDDGSPGLACFSAVQHALLKRGYLPFVFRERSRPDEKGIETIAQVLSGSSC